MAQSTRWQDTLIYVLERGINRVKRFRFSVLLLSQILFIFLYPLLQGGFGEWLLHVLASFLFLLILNLCARTRRALIINTLITLLIALFFVMDYIKYFTPLPFPVNDLLFLWCYDGVFILFYLYLTFALCIHMLTDKQPHIDTLAGTAAVYLMIGLTWTLAYSNLQDLHPGAFHLNKPHADITYINWLFYSISLLVSSSYTEVVPVSSYAQCLTILESVIGALYIAIVTARMVGVPFQDPTPEDEEWV